ncbi:unnamed protein product, partial [Dracunculus medinensis]|uniref:DB domain-containing protein n=1 Tax=Dracunculus medinensis TaxID=318479 RepID=A0A0N4UEA1_DRAME
VLKCPYVKRQNCCFFRIPSDCVPKHCFNYVIQHCPDRKSLMFKRFMRKPRGDIRRAPNIFLRSDELPKCGIEEMEYRPCISKAIANKLFNSCCQLYVPQECQFMCIYETNQTLARKMLITMITEKKCSMKYLSTILYCASQNRDNRKCCTYLGLNAPHLQVGSRCLRMCDPSGTAIERLEKEDATCLYNWNVIMYCHQSGMREM